MFQGIFGAGDPLGDLVGRHGAILVSPRLGLRPPSGLAPPTATTLPRPEASWEIERTPIIIESLAADDMGLTPKGDDWNLYLLL